MHCRVIQQAFLPAAVTRDRSNDMRPSLIDLGSYSLLQMCLTMAGATFLRNYPRMRSIVKSQHLASGCCNAFSTGVRRENVEEESHGYGAGLAVLLLSAQDFLLRLAWGLNTVSRLIFSEQPQIYTSGHIRRSRGLRPPLQWEFRRSSAL